MSHWAEIDENNKVIRVLVGDNNESDEGQAFMESLGGTWIKTSYNARIKKNFAGISFNYDPIRDAFIPPKPFNSWVIDEKTCHWIAPVLAPQNDKKYWWDEETISWKPVIDEADSL